MTTIIDKLQKHLKDKNYDGRNRDAVPEVSPPIVCNDNFILSVQASRFHYCEPRDNFGPYTQVEVMCISGQEIPEFEQYFDGDSVYAFVPIELVAEVIERESNINERPRVPNEAFYGVVNATLIISIVILGAMLWSLL